MPESTLKPGWRRVKLGDFVRLIGDRCDPAAEGIERYVGLEHIETEDLQVRSWGLVSEGTTFTSRFRPGQVLFGKRRAYQRKVAFADFEGVCSGDIYIMESASSEHFLPELLPFLCQTQSFFEHAVGTSAGSLSPRTNWASLASYEFALPPLDEQRRIIRVLAAAEATRSAFLVAHQKAEALYRSAAAQSFSAVRHGRNGFRTSPVDWAPKGWPCVPLGELNDQCAPICYGIVQLGDLVPDGVPVLRTENLNGDYSRDLRRVSCAVDEEYRRSRTRGGDVLLAIQGVSTGKIGVVPSGFEGNINRHVARLRLGPRMHREFFVHLWRSIPYSAYVASIAVGTTKPELTIGDLRSMLVPCPPVEIQEQVAGKLSHLERWMRELIERGHDAQQVQRALISASMENG